MHSRLNTCVVCIWMIFAAGVNHTTTIQPVAQAADLHVNNRHQYVETYWGAQEEEYQGFKTSYTFNIFDITRTFQVGSHAGIQVHGGITVSNDSYGYVYGLGIHFGPKHAYRQSWLQFGTETILLRGLPRFMGHVYYNIHANQYIRIKVGLIFIAKHEDNHTDIQNRLPYFCSQLFHQWSQGTMRDKLIFTRSIALLEANNLLEKTQLGLSIGIEYRMNNV